MGDGLTVGRQEERRVAVLQRVELGTLGLAEAVALVGVGIAHSAEPTPPPYVGPIVSLDIPSAGVSARWPVEERGTTSEGGTDYMQEPTSPDRIAWYPQFGRPGFRSSNTIFAGHVNYAGWSVTPFASLAKGRADDSIYVSMGNGTVYTYSVKSVDMVAAHDLDRAQVLHPALDNNTERITLITCGGDFFIQPGFGGEYTSRLIVTATRYIPD